MKAGCVFKIRNRRARVYVEWRRRKRVSEQERDRAFENFREFYSSRTCGRDASASLVELYIANFQLITI